MSVHLLRWKKDEPPPPPPPPPAPTWRDRLDRFIGRHDATSPSAAPATDAADVPARRSGWWRPERRSVAEAADAPEAPAGPPADAPPGERWWPGRRPAGEPAGRRWWRGRAAPARRKRAPWRRKPHNPVSVLLWAASWAAVLILVLGMLLVSADANPNNWFVHATMRTGDWLATPFRDVFHNPNPRHQLYENWGLTAAVYFVAGRTLAWLLQWPR